ncbi:sigma factor-like helix-turn-helix DNA-binding protein [Sorangium sp. So ce726]|uniref:RNA polymerase sigma factor n=1 Tax=Sorangium sp. So ce726 TaxID=3133319 RepID=UPI003F62D786
MGLADEACFESADVAPSSEQRIVTNQRIAIAIRLLATIAPERRAILIMTDMVEIPVREIARSLGLNESTASSRLRLAREDYRAAVKRLRPERSSARSGPACSCYRSSPSPPRAPPPRRLPSAPPSSRRTRPRPRSA